MGKARIGVIALVMMLALAVGLVAGCSGAEESVSSQAASSASVSVSSSASSSSSSSSASSSSAAAQLPEGSSFKVTFIDVGQGDAAVISCDGHNMIIDGGPADASQIMYTWCKQNNITEADYVVATHPDSDHTGGIAGALQVVTAKRAFCSATQDDGRAFQSMVKYLANQGVSVEVPVAGSTFALGSATVQIVGPIWSADGGRSNNDSLVLRVTYGDTSILFAADAEEDEERALVNSGYVLTSTVLKVPHHGSNNSSSSAFLRAVQPAYAVISVGSGNSYGHPTQGALSRLEAAGAQIYRTDIQGDVVINSDGARVEASVEKNAGAQTGISAAEAQQETVPAGVSYIGNKNSRKFHLPTCKTLPKESNRVYFDARDAATNAGYTPCGNCKP